MAHTELDVRERRAIEDMLNAKVPVSKINTEIGRHRSTVYREINAPVPVAPSGIRPCAKPRPLFFHGKCNPSQTPKVPFWC